MAETAAQPALITADELAAMGDVGRCELIDGRVVTMAPTNDEGHGGIEVNFSTALHTFVRPRRLGHVRGGETGIVTRRNPDRVRGADAAYISNERYARRTQGRAFLDVPPEIVVEVLSPDDRAVDVNEKLREYLAMGVSIVWVADPKARAVLAYRSMTDVAELHEGDVLTAPDVLPGFELPVASVFDI